MCVCVCVCALTLKSIPTVEMKLPARKAPSLKRTSRQVFPTPESPTSITWDRDAQKVLEVGRGTAQVKTYLQIHRSLVYATLSQTHTYINTHSKIPKHSSSLLIPVGGSTLCRPVRQREMRVSFFLSHQETQNSVHFSIIWSILHACVHVFLI